MPVDWFTPAVFAILMVGLPIYAGLRGTAGAFVGTCAICLAGAGGVIFLEAGKTGDEFLAVVVMLWAIPTAVGVGLLSSRRRRRDDAGIRCARCGYDLRATPERCPECGEEARGESSGN